MNWLFKNHKKRFGKDRPINGKNLHLIFLILLLILSGCAANVHLHGKYDVVSVIDGDTIVIDLDGEDVKVRLIGVDAPESVHPDPSKNSEAGKRAAAYTTKLLSGTSVYLEYDIAQTDAYNRLLAYVYLSDRKTMVNELLLTDGLATTMTIQPNSKYAERFYKLMKDAQGRSVGIWGENGT